MERAPADGMLVARLEAAVQRRRPLGRPGIDLVRLVDGPGDDLDGLVVEAFGPVARVELLGPRYASHAAAIADGVSALWPGLTGCVAVDRPGAGRPSSTRLLRGRVPAGVVVLEDGARFLLRPREPDAVGAGIFLDQREGRRWVRRVARGRPAMNLFAHAGAFGVAAAVGGASRVDHVDAAKKCAPWAATNLALNGIDPRPHRFLVDDAFKVLRRAGKRGPTYGVIVCDPPTTAQRPKGGRFVAKDSLDELAADCLRALLPGGHLLLSCNDRRLVQADLHRALERAAEQAGRSLDALDDLALGSDFTALAPEQRSTKGVLVTVA